LARAKEEIESLGQLRKAANDELAKLKAQLTGNQNSAQAVEDSFDTGLGLIPMPQSPKPNEKVQAEIKSLQELNRKTQEELAKVREELESLRQSGAREDSEDVLDLETFLEPDEEPAGKELVQARAEIETLQELNRKTQEELAKVREELDSYRQSELSDKSGSDDILELELLPESSGPSEGELAEAKAEVETLRKSRNTIGEELARSKEEIESLQQLHKATKEEMAKVKEEMTSKKQGEDAGDLAQAKEQIESMRKLRANTSVQLSKAREEIQFLKKSRSALAMELSRAREEIQAFEKAPPKAPVPPAKSERQVGTPAGTAAQKKGNDFLKTIKL